MFLYCAEPAEPLPALVTHVLDILVMSGALSPVFPAVHVVPAAVVADLGPAGPGPAPARSSHRLPPHLQHQHGMESIRWRHLRFARAGGGVGPAWCGVGEEGEELLFAVRTPPRHALPVLGHQMVEKVGPVRLGRPADVATVLQVLTAAARLVPRCLGPV